jgi:glycosyltransferase involved in cell wall biosynthesis
MVEKKGMDVLLRALAELRDKSYRIELSIAGDGPLRHELEQLAKDLGLSESVQFIGNLAHHQVKEWMHDLDAFVLACKQDANGDMDGIPVVLMEAMSQSVPVISTRLSGIPELVLDGKTGLLAEPADPDDLATRVDQLLSSTKLRDDLAAAARSHVESEFGQEVNLDRLLRHMTLAK